MSTELIRAVYVRPDGVYLNSKSNNDDYPFREWKCDSLTDVYQSEGQRGLDREMVRMFSEYASIQGRHPSVERYRPCLNNWGLQSKEFVQPLRAEYDKLTPEDKQTVGLPAERQTPAAMAYAVFRRNLENEFYEGLSKLAVSLDKNPRQKTAERGRKDNAIMNRERLLEIGNEVASLWGGSCYDLHVNQKKKEVVFDCIEHGERFSTTLSFAEIKTQHGVDLSKQQRNQER